MDDVYKMLNYIVDENFMTHQLPTAMQTLRAQNPEWFQNAVSVVDELKHLEDTNDFSQLMKAIDFGYPNFEIELGKAKY